jgi:hypothetical protein
MSVFGPSSDADAAHLLPSPALRKAMTDFAAGTLGGIAGKIVEYVTLSILHLVDVFPSI